MPTILSSDQIHTLHHTFYHPSNNTSQPVKATLLIVHGMAEHSGRYDAFAQYMAENGIAVLSYDQLGHGRTIVSADELGYFEARYPMQTLLKDVVIMAEALKARYPGVPHFIMGHSMGSFITRCLLQHHSIEFAGAILMGTSDTDPLAKVFLPVTQLLNKVKPHQHNVLFAKTTNKILNGKLKDKTSDSQFAWVCKNPEALAAYEADPLCGFDFTNNGFLALFSLMLRGLAKEWAQTIDHDFPMLFVSGEEDPIGNMSKGIKSLTKRMHTQGFTHIETLLYAGMRHEPLHEADRHTVYKDILHWLTMQTPAQSDEPTNGTADKL